MTKSSTPVGVDFFWIGERGGQFGPFGALKPMQKDNQTGRGIFRCSDDPGPYAGWELNSASETTTN